VMPAFALLRKEGYTIVPLLPFVIVLDRLDLKLSDIMLIN
jgi:hypothetical protein